MVVSLGTAGSRTPPPAEVFQVASITHRDMDVSPLGFPKGLTPLSDAPVVFEIPFRVPGLPAAGLSTGANIVAGAARGDIDADMVDVETWAVWRARRKFDVPMIGPRGISDGEADVTGDEDRTRYRRMIDEKPAAAPDLVDAALAN